MLDFQKTQKTLRRYGYTTKYFETKEEAATYLENTIVGKSVGFGDSNTLMAMNLYDILRGSNTVFDPQQSVDNESFLEIAKKSLTTEVYISSVNAMSETGEMVNIDGTGNRIAGSLFGHDKIYFILSMNKLTPTLEEAMWRAKNIAAPQNAKRLGVKTPCAIKGDRCYNCSSPERICNGTVIYQRKMANVETEIIFINETLGL